VDPGLARTGVAVVTAAGAGAQVAHVGVITTPARTPGPRRLAMLHRQLVDLISETRPDVGVVEQLFFASNSTTAMQVAEARGVILLAMELSGLPVWEYTPGQVKTSVAGYGRASKAQVMRMVSAAVGMDSRLPDDAFDAVAIALCHVHSARLSPGRQIS
jgi:crossover junction endodeoxyribonuclease RuvC